MKPISFIISFSPWILIEEGKWLVLTFFDSKEPSITATGSATVFFDLSKHEDHNKKCTLTKKS